MIVKLDPAVSLRGISSLPHSPSSPAPAPSGRGGPGGGASRPRVAWGPVNTLSSEPPGWAFEGGQKTGLTPEPPTIPFSASAVLESLSEARVRVVLRMAASRLCRRCLPELISACLVESLTAGGRCGGWGGASAWLPCPCAPVKAPTLSVGCPFPSLKYLCCLLGEGVPGYLEPMLPRARGGSWPQPASRFPTLLLRAEAPALPGAGPRP